MKILYIHQYFKTPNEPGGTRSYWISQGLLKSGYKVTMVTGRSLQDKGIERVNVDGIDVIYIRNRYSNEMNAFRRIISFLRFMFLATIVSLKEKNINLVFATSTPLSIGFPALILKWVKGIPFIFEVRDLWPEAPIQLGVITNPVFIKFARWFEKLIYKNSLHIIALSPGMKEGVLKVGISPQKVDMIPNMSKIDEFYIRPKNQDVAARYNIDTSCFNAIHFGALGKAINSQYIFDAAYEGQ
jgi:glycosyltransferase involved in cell wall biosynthesis